ncbi:50S ribosomal protein L30 [bacterium]|nr:50S ribosomal protein L30 [bacterium]
MDILKIKQKKSAIGKSKDQKNTIKCLGFRKLNQIIEVENTPSIRGMIKKVIHLVEVLD